jgi:integrase
MECDIKEIRKLVKRIRDGKPPAVEGKFEDVYRDPALPGFGIRVLHTGAASWYVHYKRLGRQGKVTLGDVRVLDREQAVEVARDVLAKIQLRILDPQAAKREAMRANKVTFESLVPLFLEAKRKGRNGKPGLRDSTHESYTRYLTGDYFRPLHKLPIDEITGGQINTQLDRITAKNGGDAAWAAVSPMKGLFKWAIKTGKLPEGHKSPMLNVEEPVKGEPRSRVLSNDEIRTIWKTCEAWEADALADDERSRTGRRAIPGKPTITDYSRGVRLVFLTGCRSQEIGELSWSEVDLEHHEIRIPPARTKTGIELCNPLPEMAIDILREIKKRPHEPFVFGTIKGKGLELGGAARKIDRRIARAGRPTINPEKEQEVRDLLAANMPTYRIRGTAHVNWKTIQAIKARMKAGVPVTAVPENPKLARWTVHDIRRTFRTRLSECGVDRHIAEKLLGHIGHQNAIERVYDRHDYWSEKRIALNKWQDKLRAIIDGTAEKIVTRQFGRKSA